MMTMKALLCAILILLGSTPEAKSQSSSEDQLIQWTTSAGQMLYRYHVAYAAAFKAVELKAGVGNVPKLYAGGPYDAGWAFSFGDFESNGEFILDYGVIVGANGNVLKMDEFDFRRVASLHHTQAARALSIILDDLAKLRLERSQLEADEFRIAVLPFPQTEFTTFVSPAQNCADLTLVGNDFMVASNRTTGVIRDRTYFIQSLLRFPRQMPSGVVALAIKVPQNPMPSPVDVLIAMERREPIYVFAELGAFEIKPDGSIRKLDSDDPMLKFLHKD
jgi:hypothetical protein